jgi:hypothetical protein
MPQKLTDVPFFSGLPVASSRDETGGLFYFRIALK